MKIASIKDLEVLNLLNKEVQDMHHKFMPKVYKKHKDADMKSLFKAILEKENSEIILKYVNSKAIGYLMYEIVNKEESTFRYAHSFVYIHHIAIQSEYKKQGLCKRIYKLCN